MFYYRSSRVNGNPSMTEVPVIPDIEFKHVRSFLLFELFISPISRTRFITYLLHS